MKIKMLSTMILCLFASQAFAGGAAPFYLGAGLGYVLSENGDDQYIAGKSCSTMAANAGVILNPNDPEKDQVIGVGCDDSDNRGMAGHIYGGYQISDSLAIEGGYTNLGQTASFKSVGANSASQDTHGLTIVGIAKRRLTKSSPISVYGKLGAFAWQTEAEGNLQLGPEEPVLTVTHKDKGISPIVGLGVEAELSHQTAIRVGWDRYMGVGDGGSLVSSPDENGNASLDTVETDVDVINAGVNFSFL